jgi:hypothetical protein
VDRGYFPLNLLQAVRKRSPDNRLAANVLQNLHKLCNAVAFDLFQRLLVGLEKAATNLLQAHKLC